MSISLVFVSTAIQKSKLNKVEDKNKKKTEHSILHRTLVRSLFSVAWPWAWTGTQRAINTRRYFNCFSFLKLLISCKCNEHIHFLSGILFYSITLRMQDRRVSPTLGDQTGMFSNLSTRSPGIFIKKKDWKELFRNIHTRNNTLFRTVSFLYSLNLTGTSHCLNSLQ